jgi:hypothetical protein
MALKDKRKAAARARSGKSSLGRKQDKFLASHSHQQEFEATGVNTIDDGGSDSDSDCGYTGGVTVDVSETECRSEDWEDTGSDNKSLSELSGDDLDENMAEIRAELEVLEAPSIFAMMLKGKIQKHWKKAESDRGLGYNGLSDRTWQRRKRNAWERVTRRESARTS